MPPGPPGAYPAAGYHPGPHPPPYPPAPYPPPPTRSSDRRGGPGLLTVAFILLTVAAVAVGAYVVWKALHGDQPTPPTPAPFSVGRGRPPASPPDPAVTDLTLTIGPVGSREERRW